VILGTVTITLITGANKGLGRETARRLLEVGRHLPGSLWHRPVVKFSAVVKPAGNATGVEVPAEVVDALGSGRRPKVVITIGGHTWRSRVASAGDRFIVGISAANRAASAANRAASGASPGLEPAAGRGHRARPPAVASAGYSPRGTPVPKHHPADQAEVTSCAR